MAALPNPSSQSFSAHFVQKAGTLFSSFAHNRSQPFVAGMPSVSAANPFCCKDVLMQIAEKSHIQFRACCCNKNQFLSEFWAPTYKLALATGITIPAYTYTMEQLQRRSVIPQNPSYISTHKNYSVVWYTNRVPCANPENKTFRKGRFTNLNVTSAK